MASMNPQDPFLQVQADALSQLDRTRSLYNSYQRILSLSSSSSAPSSSNNTSPELTAARSDLSTSLSTLEEDLTDLRESVQAVESDPYKYGLELEEVIRRKRLVQDIGHEIRGIRAELSRPGGGAATAGRSNGDGGRAPGVAPGEDFYAEFEQHQQLRLMSEQEEQLDSVYHTVGNLRQQADSMGRELAEQAEMLDEVDTLADRVGGRLQTGIQKVGWVMRKNEDTMSSCCIGVLILVLIILLVLVLVI